MDKILAILILLFFIASILILQYVIVTKFNNECQKEVLKLNNIIIRMQNKDK